MLFSEFKKELLYALRSGNYKQAKGALRRLSYYVDKDLKAGQIVGVDQLNKVDTFCCLGVMCDIVFPKNWEAEYNPDGKKANKGGNDYLPSEFKSLFPNIKYFDAYHHTPWADILIPTSLLSNEQLNRLDNPSKINQRLSTLNDRGFTFSEIADLFDRAYPDEQQQLPTHAESTLLDV